MPSWSEDGFGGSVDATSDYVFRGISLSHGEPSLQADFHYSTPRGFSAGVWASSVELNSRDGRTVEFDAYVGFRRPLSLDWTAKFNFVHYAYPFNAAGSDYDYNELAGSLSFRDILSFTAAWSFDASNYYTAADPHSRDSFSFEETLAIPLPGALVATFGAGYYELHAVPLAHYKYWNVGVGYDWRAWHLDVNFIGTSSEARQLFYSHWMPAMNGTTGTTRMPAQGMAMQNNQMFYNHVTGNRLAVTLLWRF